MTHQDTVIYLMRIFLDFKQTGRPAPQDPATRHRVPFISWARLMDSGAEGKRTPDFRHPITHGCLVSVRGKLRTYLPMKTTL
jgi:hypothetical protein